MTRGCARTISCPRRAGWSSCRSARLAMTVKIEAFLLTERLVLEPVRELHARELFAPLQDARIFTYMPEDPPGTPEALAIRYHLWERRVSPDGNERWLNWVVRLATTGEAIGLLQATVRAEAPAIVAYLLFPAHWGRGYAREGLSRVLRLLFEEYGVVCAAALVDTRNARSIALLRALGFRLAQTVRQADFYKGRVSDEHRFQLPRAVWLRR
ncbi:N-acetyltransferase [bacterium]|nr:MAG: N-acetyltransferase [bacterium]